MDRTTIAAESLRAFVRACDRARDEDYVLDLQRLRGLTGSLTELIRVTEEIAAEAEEWAVEHQESEDALRSEIVAFRKAIVVTFPQLKVSETVAPPPANQADVVAHLKYQNSLARFDSLSRARTVERMTLAPDRYENQSSTAILQHILLNVLATLNVDGVPPNVSVADAQRTVRAFGARVEWHHRERIVKIRSSPAAVLRDIAGAVKQINPVPEPEPAHLDVNEVFKEVLQDWFAVPVPKILYGIGSQSAGDKATKEEIEHFHAWRLDMDYRLQRLMEELHFRLLTRQSVDSSLARYAARCMWYRREELLATIDARRRRRVTVRGIEQMLVADAAAYLFDMGFNVDTEVTRGVSRLDLLREDQERPLLVEGKMYASGPGRSQLIQGLRQLLDYAARLRTGAREPEACVLLFRLGGGRLEVPDRVTIGGRTLRIVIIDLASASESGSRAPAPLPLSLEDLEAEIVRKAGKRATKATPKPSSRAKGKRHTKARGRQVRKSRGSRKKGRGAA